MEVAPRANGSEAIPLVGVPDGELANAEQGQVLRFFVTHWLKNYTYVWSIRIRFMWFLLLGISMVMCMAVGSFLEVVALIVMDHKNFHVGDSHLCMPFYKAAIVAFVTPIGIFLCICMVTLMFVFLHDVTSPSDVPCPNFQLCLHLMTRGKGGVNLDLEDINDARFLLTLTVISELPLLIMLVVKTCFSDFYAGDIWFSFYNVYGMVLGIIGSCVYAELQRFCSDRFADALTEATAHRAMLKDLLLAPSGLFPPVLYDSIKQPKNTMLGFLFLFVLMLVWALGMSVVNMPFALMFISMLGIAATISLLSKAWWPFTCRRRVFDLQTCVFMCLPIVCAFNYATHWSLHNQQKVGIGVATNDYLHQHHLADTPQFADDLGLLEGRGEGFGICQMRPWGKNAQLSIIDMAIISAATYQTKDSVNAFLDAAFGGIDGKTYKLEDLQDGSIIGRHLTLYFPDDNLWVIGFRGTANSKDVFADFVMYPQVSTMLVLGHIAPVLQVLPRCFIRRVAAFSLVRGMATWDDPVETATAYVTEMMHQHPHDKFMLTGHSMGGAIAGITAARLDVPGVLFHPMGELYSTIRYNFTAQAVAKRIVTVKVRGDPISHVDKQGGFVQTIQCEFVGTSKVGGCHMIRRTICELWKGCGDKPNNRSFASVCRPKNK